MLAVSESAVSVRTGRIEVRDQQSVYTSLYYAQRARLRSVRGRLREVRKRRFTYLQYEGLACGARVAWEEVVEPVRLELLVAAPALGAPMPAPPLVAEEEGEGTGSDASRRARFARFGVAS